eukprot:744485-Amphidinium_carterae.1
MYIGRRSYWERSSNNVGAAAMVGEIVRRISEQYSQDSEKGKLFWKKLHEQTILGTIAPRRAIGKTRNVQTTMCAIVVRSGDIVTSTWYK